MRNPKILICVDWFEPAIRAGGPITSCVNLVNLLSPHLTASVLTGCRDIGSTSNLTGIDCGHWNRWKEQADVWYATLRQHRLGAFLRACHQKQPDVIYLNSMFSLPGTIIPLLSSPVLRSTQFVLAPRGMLKPTALSFRKRRKIAWLRFLKLSGLASRVHWHATSEEEASEIQNHFGCKARITVIPNVPRLPQKNLASNEKEKGDLRLSFVGRIHPIKNLHLVLDLLQDFDGSCQLDIIGPTEDEGYSQSCDRLIDKLPTNIKVKRHGTLPSNKSVEIVARSHLFVLPTQGENFGHAIFEAMGVGTPVLISDQTYWKNLTSAQAGWDLPLTRIDRFREVLNELSNMEQAEFEQWRRGAHQLAHSFFAENQLVANYLKMFLGH